ncbi:MAG TPA: HEAT repeat domain-containing protein [Pyrinomonadaceae bacterium]|nr:HEAT repeat domain-containing protein [Pyrinomonadaceae bacterium]
MRTKVLTALIALTALALVVGVRGDAARAQQRGGNDNASQSSQKSGQTKHVFVGRGSDTAQGSRVTIKSDNPLNDYSAYRSGDRFYVVLPRAAAGSVARGGAGKGYSDMQVQQRGDSVVLSYRVQPGAKPRVEQKFNRLDVVFDAPEGGAQGAAQTGGTQSGAGERTANENEGSNASGRNAGQTQQANAPNTSGQSDRRNTSSVENAGAQNSSTQNSSTQNSGAQNAATQSVAASPVVNAPANGVEQGTQNSAATTEATPSATPAVDQSQVAQNQPPNTVAPITKTNAEPGTATGVSLGAYVLNHWPVALFVALFVVGLGLIFASRRAAPPQPVALEDSKIAATATLDAPRAVSLKDAHAESKSSAAEVASAPDALPLATASALASMPAAVKVGKQSGKNKKAKKKQEAREKKRQAAESRLAEISAARAVESQAAAEASSSAVAESAAVAGPPAVEPAPAAESRVAAEPSVVVEPSVAPEPHVSVEPPVEEHAVEAVVEPESSPATAEPSVAEAVPVAEAAAVAEVAASEETSIVAAVEEHEHTRVEAVESTELEVARAEAQPGEVRQVEARQPEAASTSEVAPAVAHDPEAAQAEARRLLEGGEYDRAVLSTHDSMARQMVASELLAALAGRNLERRERARAAFVEHGYFDETARDLRGAEAPAERAAAARSLALVGSLDATPHLVAALEDPSVDVRRAAVEALGSLRDPAAVGPLESLIPRERQLRNGIPSRIIRNAVEPCRAAAESRDAALASMEAPAQVAPAPEPLSSTGLTPTGPSVSATTGHPAPEAEAVTSEISPFGGGVRDEEATLEAGAPTLAAKPSSAFEETTRAVALSGSKPESETTVEATPVAEETAEIAPFVEPVSGMETAAAADELKALEAELEDFGGVHAFDEAAPAKVHFDESRAIEVSPRDESQIAEPPTVSAIEHVETDTLAAAPSSFEFHSTEPAVVEERSLQHVEETEAVEKEAARARQEAPASEWFEFDVDEKTFEPKPTAVEPSTHLFEALSGDATSQAAPDAALPFEQTRAVEPSGAAEEASAQIESGQRPAPAAEDAHATEAEEKGVAPFDEFSTVPASIQQRIASRVPSERAAAITELSHVDTDEAFQQICAAFDDDAKEVRSAAARALYDLRADRADSFTRALREATPERRRQIGASIATSGLASEAISQLTGESREKTYEAFSLLFLMAKAGEVQPLIRAIEGHPNNEVRLAVVKLLALSGQKEILPAFRRLAVRGSLPTEVRSALMEAIYQISSSTGQPSAV